MAFCGCYGPALLGPTYLTVTLPFRHAIADFSNGCGQELCEVFLKHLQKTCGFAVASIYVNPSSMVALLLPKRGVEGRQNETWQRNEDHGCGRQPRPSPCSSCRKCYASRSEVCRVHARPDDYP